MFRVLNNNKQVNKGTRFLICAFDYCSKYGWVVRLKDKKGITIINAFQKVLDNSTKLYSMRKPNQIYVDKGS